MNDEKMTIKAYRINAGYTQKDFAKKVKIGYNAYQKKEAGQSDWKGKELVRISTFLNVPIDEFRL